MEVGETMQLLIFNEYEELKTILSHNGSVGNEDVCPFWDASHLEEINGENTFEFSLPGNHSKAEHVVKKNKAGFIDEDDNFQLFEITRVEEEHNDTQEKRVYARHVFYELKDAERIGDVRPTDNTATQALTSALDGTNWIVGTVANLGLNSTTFYRENPLSAIHKVVDAWGGELRFRIVTVGNAVSGRFVDLLARRGAETGHSFEYGRNVESITKTEYTGDTKTAMYGYGKGEKSGTGFTRRITFEDIGWAVAGGDPVDKPLGQDWVGDEDALKDNGRVIKSKSALSFDGVDDYVLLSSNGFGTFNNQSFTIETWVKLPDLSGDKVLFSYDYTSHNLPYYACHLRIMASGIYLGYNLSGTIISTVTSFNTLKVENINTWTHISATFTSGVQKIYVNGEEVFGTTNAGVITYYNQEVWLGRGNFGGYFKDYLDDVRIWNVARTQAEIQADMNLELIGNETGLVGYWKFNEGTGTTALDSTANGNDGAINGATWVEDDSSPMLKRINRFGDFEDSEEEDKVILLEKTWNTLQKAKEIPTNYKMKAVDMEHLVNQFGESMDHTAVRLGDTNFAIDNEYNPVMQFTVRVIKVKNYIGEPERRELEHGNFLPLFTNDSEFERIKAKVNNQSGVWDDTTVTDSNFPDTTPEVPTNFSATGIFRTAQLKWDYAAISYIAAYEVYASTIAGFTPDTANLVFRGKTGGIVHEGSVNTMYYFRIRAINHHGTASGYANEISASTVRITEADITPQIITNQLIAEDAEIDFAKIANVEITDAEITGTLSANLIRAGILESESGETQFNLDDGTFSLADGKLKFDGTTLNTEGQIEFTDSGAVVAWISGQNLYIKNVRVTEGAIIGNHKIEKYNNDITLVKWVGEG